MILEALAKSEKPCGNKDLVEATGLDKKVISKEITALKKRDWLIARFAANTVSLLMVKLL